MPSIGALADAALRAVGLREPLDSWSGLTPMSKGLDGAALVVSDPPKEQKQRRQRSTRAAGPPSQTPPRPGPSARAFGPLAPWMNEKLRRLTRRKRIDAAVPLRARVIRMLSRDPCVSAVARRLEIHRDTVRLWRDRFLRYGLKGLHDRSRSGRKPRITDVVRCELMSMACNRPASYGIKHRRTWTYDTLHEAFRKTHPNEKISRSSVMRILKGADMKPHRIQGWLHSQDPEFRAKVTHICSLYVNPPPGEIVLCVDEKTGMQALKRKHPTKWAGLGRPGKWEYEYKRLGTRTLFAAFNTKTGDVFGEVSVKRKAMDLLRFMGKLAKRYPKGKIHIIWDNLNIHYDGASKRWAKFNEEHGGRFHFHYTPIHASWVNQVELFFARVQRRVLRYASFDSVTQMSSEVMDFIDHWNQHERKPYNWKFRGYPLQEARQAA